MKAKTKNPSIHNDPPAASGKGGEAIDYPEKTSVDPSADLDADELAAFEKIMGDIDNQEEEKLNGSVKGIGGEKEEPVLAEDQLATLNEVIETITNEDQTDADVPDPADTAATHDEGKGDEGLDEDQQRAFERIMAQIESGGKADDAAGFEKDGDTDPGPETVDDFDADLAKVVQEADTAEHDDNQDAEPSESDDDLNGDQLQAFESIMAQIKGGDPEPTAADVEKAPSTDPNPEHAPEDLSQGACDPSDDNTDEKSQNITDDIDIILAEIASADNTPQIPKAAVDDTGSAPATGEASENRAVNADRVDRKKEDRDLEPTVRHQTAAPTHKEGDAGESVETPMPATPPGDRLSAATPVRSGWQPVPPSKPLREATKPTGGRSKRVILASVVAVLCLALAGYFYEIPRRIVDPEMIGPDADTSRRDVMAETLPVPPLPQPVAVDQGMSDQSRLKTAGENLERLRNQFIAKQAEIGELRAYYQAGIDAEIQGIVDRVQNAGKGSISFKTAMDDPHITLGLSAIQRRGSYIEKLETPLNSLVRDSEELLFFSRKAGMLALMAGQTSDIDVDGFINQAEAIRNVLGQALAHLNIDAVSASPPALESIWQDIEKRLTSTTVKPATDNRVSDMDNTVIWKNFCDGDFTQKHQLTQLSPEAARCLSTYRGKDLFLNALTDLSPEAARQLAAWEGDWLGLNGLQELSPEAAVHLSRWKGKGISLNGLSHLSARVVAILSDWQGDQIELVNVKHMAYWENPKTHLFLSEDLKRKLNATRK